MISNILKKIFYHITGGRPMTKLSRIGFTDGISGEVVRYYKDKLGREWMATSKWAVFRVLVR